MQVYPINNYQPNFNALIVNKKADFSPEQMKIIDKMTSALKQPVKRGEEWKSSIARAEDKGFDIFITKGSNKSSVKIDLSTDYKNKHDEVVFTDYIPVGEYSAKDPFTLNEFNDIMVDIENDPKDIILNCLMVAAAVMGALIAIFCLGKPNKYVQPEQNLKILQEQVVDTLKTLPEKTLDITKMFVK